VASGEESSLISVFRQPDTAWFSVLYSFTFGGFVGLTSFLTLFFHDRYHLQKVRAADFTTLVVISGSFLRPVGGWLADRIGGYRLLLALLTGVGGLLFAISSLPEFSVVVPLRFLSMGMLGMGNGAVFQLVPQRFSKHIGVITGVVGAAGGLGGFLLPSVLGAIKDRTALRNRFPRLCRWVRYRLRSHVATGRDMEPELGRSLRSPCRRLLLPRSGAQPGHRR